MKWFIFASTISWFYFIENMTTVLLSDTPWCFSPTMIYVILVRFIAVINIFELKKRLNHIHIISCVLCHFPGCIKYQMYHPIKLMSLKIYLLIYVILRMNVALLSFVLCIKFEDDSRVINRNIVVFFCDVLAK